MVIIRHSALIIRRGGEIMSNTIQFIRGDTYVVNLFVKNADGTAYVPQDTDIITMTVRAKGDQGPIVIQKTTGDADVAATPQGWIIVLQASDTAELVYVKYVYDVAIKYVWLYTNGNSDK